MNSQHMKKDGKYLRKWENFHRGNLESKFVKHIETIHSAEVGLARLTVIIKILYIQI